MRGGETSILDVVADWDLSHVSPGPGFTERFSNKNDIFPYVCFSHTTPTYDSVAFVKEEVAKLTKIEEGNYRFVFNYCFSDAVYHKLFSTRFNKSLSRTGLMYSADGRTVLPMVGRHFQDMVNLGGSAFNCDTSLHDRRVGASLLALVYRVRTFFNRLTTNGTFGYDDDLIERTVHPSFWALDDEGAFINVKSDGGVISGHPNTSYDNTLIMLFVWFLFQERNSLCGKVIAYGDNLDCAFDSVVSAQDLINHWATFGMVLKCHPVGTDLAAFDSMSCKLTPAVQPYWKLEKSVVALSYVEANLSRGDSSLYVVCMRAAAVACYNYYHPQYDKFCSLFRYFISMLPQKEQKEVENVWLSGIPFYVCTQSRVWDFKMDVQKRVRSYDAAFDDVMRGKGVNPHNFPYVRMALDPFHDVPLDIEGAPDSVAGPSVVFDIKKEFRLSSPAGIAESATWATSINFFPLRIVDYQNGAATYPPLFAQTCVAAYSASDQTSALGPRGTLSNPTTVQAPLSGGCMPPLVISQKVESGNSSVFFDPNATADSISINLYTPTLDDLPKDASNVRFIGGAIEVRNTSSELYNGGQSVTYKQRYRSEPAVSRVINAPATGSVHLPVLHGTTPPSTIAAAKQLGGVTMEAREGVLIPIPVDVMSYGEEVAYPRHRIYDPRSADPPTANSLLTWTSRSIATYTAGTSTITVYPPEESCDIAPYMVGSIFSGLHPNSTLLVTVRFFIEVFPRSGSPLYPLCTPSPPLDLAANQFIVACFENMPPGVPVSDNAGGDYFKSVLQTARLLPPLVRFVSNPSFVTAGPALQSGTQLVKMMAPHAKKVMKQVEGGKKNTTSKSSSAPSGARK